MKKDMKVEEVLAEPWSKPWPSEELEAVTQCPVCGESIRNILHSDLIDNTFRVAPGKWNLWQCAQCRSAYIDPRPTPETIHFAYEGYYTHSSSLGKEKYTSLSFFRKIRRLLVNGYTNWKFGTQAVPSSWLGIVVVPVIPALRKTLSREYRHLPKALEGGGTLLDLGCGDGTFLSIAQSCGWNVVGLEPDAEAAANAARKGLTIFKGTIDHFEGQLEQFDVITMNHVIEHVHDPLKTLRSCYALLKPDGQLWLETPNIDSFGHLHFQKNWRGLEAPRHLTLFNHRSLMAAITDVGFSSPKSRGRRSACYGIFKASDNIQKGCSPYQLVAFSSLLHLKSSIANFAEIVLPWRREFLTVTALKKIR